MFTRLVVLTCVAGLTQANPAVRHTGDVPYIDILEQYQKGDDDAVKRLARLDAKAIESGERQVVAAFERARAADSPETRLVRAAIAAHTEAALPGRLGTGISWFPHLDVAERYAERLAAKDRDDPVALAWWLIAIGAMHEQRNYAQAAIVAHRGQRACGARPELVFALGVTHELAWAWEHERDLPLPFSGSVSDVRVRFTGSLAEAEKAYAQVVTSQPEFFGARIRLGRVQTLRGDHEAAVRTIAAVPDSASPGVVYLARLFEGDALERLGRIEAARKQYDVAIRSVPNPHSAVLALAYLQYQAGERMEAATGVGESLADPGTPEENDPWFWYSMGLGGIVSPELSALRAMVRQ